MTNVGLALHQQATIDVTVSAVALICSSLNSEVCFLIQTVSVQGVDA